MSKSTKAQRKPAPPKKRAQPPRYTLEEAFDYFNIPSSDFDPSQSALNNERAIRAVAFLLHTCTDHGNENMQAMAAEGVAHVLETIAGNVASLDSQRAFHRDSEPRGGNEP